MNEVRAVAADEVRAKAQEVVAAVGDAMGKDSMLLLKYMRELNAKLTADIPAKFEVFNFGKPEKLDPMMANVALAGDSLYQMEMLGSDADLSSQWLADWKGPAADTFHQVFLHRLPAVAENQMRTIYALHNSIKISQQIMYAARANVIDIGDQTISALKKFQDSKKKGFWDRALPIINIVGTVAAAVVPVAGAAKLAQGVAAVAAAKKLNATALLFVVLAQAAPAKAVVEDWDDVGGPSVPCIIASMDRAVHKLWEGVCDQTRILNEAISRDVAQFDAQMLLPHAAEVTVDAANNRDLESFRPPPADD